MSGNTNSYLFQKEKRERIAKFQKEMDKYGLRVRPTVSVFSTSYPNKVMLVMETEEYNVRGHGAQLEQIRSEGYYIVKRTETK